MGAIIRYLKIQEWAQDDRPREKLIQKGASALSNVELLAVLIGSGLQNMNSVELARHLLKENDNDLNTLAKRSAAELQKINGIGEAKAVTIASAMELAKRREKALTYLKPIINTAKLAYQIMKPELIGKVTEEFWVLILNRAQRLLKKCQISKGGLAKTTADPRTIFKSALEHNATNIILMHNHPSGDPAPSPADIALTKSLVKTSRILDIQIADHVIFADSEFFSFENCGIMPK